jgi:hypothetical protein
MVLTQQDVNGAAENLPAHEDTMITGPMGDCVSIVVLWNFAGARAGNVRGHHGSGGFGAVNLASLFAGVPNNANTVVHCFFGSIAQASGDPARAPGAIGAYVALANINYHNISNASVTRTNVVTQTVMPAPRRGSGCCVVQ